jgi:hypothetical protein
MAGKAWVATLEEAAWGKIVLTGTDWGIDGRHQEAVDIMAQLKGVNVPLDDPAVQRKKAEIDEVLALEQADGPWSIKECFQSGPLKIRRRYMLAIGWFLAYTLSLRWTAKVLTGELSTTGIQAMQQLSGINVLVYYFPRTLTTDLGMGHETALQLAAGLSVTYWVFSFIPWWGLDRISRRQPIIWGAFVCGICFLLVRTPELCSRRDVE